MQIIQQYNHLKRNKKEKEEQQTLLRLDLIENLKKQLKIESDLVHRIKNLDNNKNIKLKLEDEIEIHIIIKNKNQTVCFLQNKKPEIQNIINLITDEKQIKQIVKEQSLQLEKLEELIEKDKEKILKLNYLINKTKPHTKIFQK